MFFQSAVTEIGRIPPGLADNMLSLEKLISIEIDDRKFFGVNSTGMKYRDMPGILKLKFQDYLTHIAEQEYTVLKDMSAVELGLCGVKPKFAGIMQFPNRYIYRISEQIVIPLRGEATVHNNESKQTTIMEPEKIYRFNNRTTSEIVPDLEFLAVVLIYLDKETYQRFTPEELGNMYPRQPDEYFDLTQNITPVTNRIVHNV